MKNFYLFIMVFVSGASVLAVEILGTRILGPFYGVSLFLWSALIAVTLIALSIGYSLGGRWADRGAVYSRLCYLMIAAGIWLMLIPWIKQPLLYLSEPLGLRAAVLFAAFVLFTPPLTFLGMVSPYAIRLRAQNLEEVGKTAGDLYAISTIGSVIAAVLTGFVLIPNIGVNRLILLIGMTLILTAGIGLLIHGKNRGINAAGIVILLAIQSLGWSNAADKIDPENGLIAIQHSAYAEIRVLDKNGKRHLLIDGGVHTIVDPATMETKYPYVAVMDLAGEFFDQPGKMLLVGLGGGTLVKNFAGRGWQVESVEIDPAVTEVARQYFGLRPEEGAVHHLDGRQYLARNNKSYDLIIMDAFGSSSIPFHLVTKEAFALIASRLKKNGLLAINIESKGWNSLLVNSLTTTLATAFTNIQVLPTYQTENAIGNLIILAADYPLNLPDRQFDQQKIPSRAYLQSLAYRRDFAWDNRFSPTANWAPVLSDELNPVDLWSDAINHEARQNILDYFGLDGESW